MTESNCPQDGASTTHSNSPMLNDVPVMIQITHDIALEHSPENLKQFLENTLRFTNPKWIENNRLGRWNGSTPKNLVFFRNDPDGTIHAPRGYIREIIRFCRKEHLSYEIIDNRRFLPPLDFEFDGTLKPFQQVAADRMLKKDFGVLCAPTGSGKTVIALYMIAARKQPALVVVNTKDLAHQWIDRIQTFLNISDEDIGLIGAGGKKTGKKITVSLVQSLFKCAETVSSEIGYIIVDECHRAPSRTFTEAVTAFDAKFMLGLSATPWRRDKLSRLIYWHLGDLHFKIEASELVKSGDIMHADIVFRETEFTSVFDPTDQYPKMIADLTKNDDRNQMISRDIARESENGDGIILVLSDRKKHCETLRALIRYKYKIETAVLTGDVPLSLRKEIVEQLNRGEIRVLVATGQLIGEGFDCKNLTTLFITTPIRFSGRLVQYLGRVLRTAPGKEKARVYDYVDSKIGPLKAAAKARWRVYNSLFVTGNIESAVMPDFLSGSDSGRDG